jgi:tetratricopeptide (TPR) repeat protein
VSRPRASILALLLLAPALAVADDADAKKLLAQAYERWNDPTPERALDLGEQALAAITTDRLLRGKTLLFIGSLHQVKTGRLDDALGRYDELLALLAQDSGEEARGLRAQALVRKANIIYAERDDPEGAIELYRQAQELMHLASTADTASQLCYRVGREARRTPEEKARYLDMALTLAQEAVDGFSARTADGGRRRNAIMAKFRLQLVIVLEALGRKDEAAAQWARIAPEHLDDNCHYQLAVLHALRGDPDQARASLERAMALRPTVDTRDQLRKYIRTEPDLQGFLDREDWRPLVTDEGQ